MIVFSINIHEKPLFVLRQLENLKRYVMLPYRVILHPNEAMYDYFKSCAALKALNTVVNPRWTSKKRYHGSLYGGICANMVLAMEMFPMTHFIVLSSRNLFFKPFTDYVFPANFTGIPWEELKHWHWHSMKQSKLAVYLHEHGHLFTNTPHEGLVLERQTCQSILTFLSDHPDIHSDLLEFPHCVEEFALQSMALLFQGNVWCINTNGVRTFKKVPAVVEPNTYTWKSIRD
jgi:hypothetical protein